MGGLHLAGPELADRIKPTVNFLAEELIPAPTYVLPMHCSGFAVKVALEAALGEGCVPAGVGHPRYNKRLSGRRSEPTPFGYPFALDLALKYEKGGCRLLEDLRRSLNDTCCVSESAFAINSVF